MPKQNTGMTERIPRSMDIPEIVIGDMQISIGVFIGIIVAALIFCAYKYTTGGYQLTVISKSPKSAQYAGISIKKNILMVILIHLMLLNLLIIEFMLCLINLLQ